MQSNSRAGGEFWRQAKMRWLVFIEEGDIRVVGNTRTIDWMVTGYKKSALLMGAVEFKWKEARFYNKTMAAANA
jgi:hypothetical protein